MARRKSASVWKTVSEVARSESGFWLFVILPLVVGFFLYSAITYSSQG